MHKLFISKGLVLGKRTVGEAHVRVAVLTRDFGLIKARAQSARKEGSKLRYGLEPLTHARFTFVEGRHEWRLTGVDGSSTLLPSSILLRTRVGRVVRLLLRLIQGEEAHPVLFDTVVSGLFTLARARDIEQAESIETVLVLKTLAHLGYLPRSSELVPYIEMDFLSLELTERTWETRQLLIKAINESLSHTGL
jgi:DNA repair protein RecO